MNNPWSLLFEWVGLSFCLLFALSLSLSSPYLSSGQIFIRPAQCLTWQGSMDITCRGCKRGDWFSWWGRFWVTAPRDTLTAPIKCKTGIGADRKCLPYCRCLPTLSLSLFCVFLLQDVLMSDEVRWFRESWKISKIGLFYHVNLPFLWQSVGRPVVLVV